MAPKPIDIVRAYIWPFSGQEFVPVIEAIAHLYEQGGADSVRERMPDVIGLVDPDVEWRMEPVGTFHGHDGLLSYWRDWAVLWESYVYTVRSYEDLGAQVLTVTDVRARGRDDINVEMSTFQLWEVRDGQIVWQQTHLDRESALEAAAARSG